jgi:hypothetical protein
MGSGIRQAVAASSVTPTMRQLGIVGSIMMAAWVAPLVGNITKRLPICEAESPYGEADGAS